MATRIPADTPAIISCFAQTNGFYLMGPIVYPSGRRAPFNIDTVTVLSDSSRAQIIGRALGVYVKKNFSVDAVLGIATAGIPLAVFISQYAGIPLLYIRKEIDQRTGELLQGQYTGVKTAVLVDDIVGRGGTKDAILQLLDNRIAITDLIVLLDAGKGYQQLMDEWETKTGITIHYLARWDEVTRAMIESGALPAAAGRLQLDYLSDPDSWQDNTEKWAMFEAFTKQHSYKYGDPIV